MKPTSKNNSNNNSANKNSSTITVAATQLPGVDTNQVIGSQPYLIKENSSKAQHKEVKLGEDD